ncbi:MAG TPA: enoyl-CoA hydratase/isomerase family protein [Steroidobacteraceae bacterium]
MEVLSEIRNHVAFVTLNRPGALNALSLEMILRLRTLFGEHSADPEVYAVLIRGAGEKAFSAGGDIRALYRSFRNGGSLHNDFFAAEYPLDYLLYSYPKPYAALLDGITLGGGMGISQGSVLRVVGDRTRMAMPEVAIGFFPDVGGSYFLSRLPGQLGRYLALTGMQIGAADALYSRLADLYLPPAAVASIADDLSQLRWGNDRFADLKMLLRARAAAPPSPAALPAVRECIDAHFSQASVAGILSSLESESRGAYAGWARETASLMRSRSPTLLGVTLRQLQRGARMGLADCFRMELGMAAYAFEHGDFLEGVRATLIDKDNTPHWQPSRIEDVTDAMIDAFFKDRWRGSAHPLAALESKAADLLRGVATLKGAASAT